MMFFSFLLYFSEEDYPIPNIDPVALEATESLYQWKNKLYQLYSVNTLFHPSIHPSIHPSTFIHPPIHPFIHPIIRPSIPPDLKSKLFSTK